MVSPDQLKKMHIDPSQLALVFIAVKLSRLVESPMREDSIVDLIGYSAAFSNTKDFAVSERNSSLC